MLFFNPAYLAAFLFGLRISALFNCEFLYQSLFKQLPVLELQVCSYQLNIGQGELNIGLVM